MTNVSPPQGCALKLGRVTSHNVLYPASLVWRGLYGRKEGLYLDCVEMYAGRSPPKPSATPVVVDWAHLLSIPILAPSLKTAPRTHRFALAPGLGVLRIWGGVVLYWYPFDGTVVLAAVTLCSVVVG